MTSSYRIRSFDAKDIFARNIITKNNCSDGMDTISLKEYVKSWEKNPAKPAKYTGILDESLETVYMKKHFTGDLKGTSPRKDKISGKTVFYNHAIINVRFDNTYKEFNVIKSQNGDVYVQAGCYIDTEEDKELFRDSTFVVFSKDVNEVEALRVPIEYVLPNGMKEEDIARWNSISTDAPVKKYFKLAGGRFPCRITKRYNRIYYHGYTLYVKDGFSISEDEANRIISGENNGILFSNNAKNILAVVVDESGRKEFFLSNDVRNKWIKCNGFIKKYVELSESGNLICKTNEYSAIQYDGKTVYINENIEISKEKLEQFLCDNDSHILFSEDENEVVALVINEADETDLRLTESEKKQWEALSKKSLAIKRFELSNFRTLVRKAVPVDFDEWRYNGPDESDADIRYNEKTDSRFLRKYLYRYGFICDKVKYVRYKRSAGSSRDGQCLFICEEYSKDAEWGKWSSANLDLDTVRKKDITGWEAYSALTLSGIMNKADNTDDNKSNLPLTFALLSHQILVIPDAESTFNMNGMFSVSGKVDNHDKAHLSSKKEGSCERTNIIWDGQALLDSSVFEELGLSNHGMLLLRNRFFKTCAFNTNLQEWFEANDITSINDVFGVIDKNDTYERKTTVKDIKMVVTPSSIKYIKAWEKCYGENYRERSEDPVQKLLNTKAIRAWWKLLSKCEFGVVKTDKPTGYMYGNLVSSNYQLLNTINLNESDTEKLLEQSWKYLDCIDKYPWFLRHYTDQILAFGESEDSTDENGIAVDDNDDDSLRKLQNTRSFVLNTLISHNENIFYTELCRNFIKYVRDSFRNRIRMGKILLNGTYATLFGNPYEMLVATIRKNISDCNHAGEDKALRVLKDKNRFRLYISRSMSLEGNQIYCSRFFKNHPDGFKLLGARSPHITMGNLLIAENHYVNEISRYFNLSDEIVCINSINNNIMDRLNGCDFDSDTMLLTDNELLLSKSVPLSVPVKCDGITSQSVNTVNENEKYESAKYLAKLDSDLSTDKIGEIVNKSQHLNSLYWTYKNSGDKMLENVADKIIYGDIACLSILSGMEIDRAKRQYGINFENGFICIDAEQTLSEIEKHRKEYLGTSSEQPDFLCYIKSVKKRRLAASAEDKSAVSGSDEKNNNQEGILGKVTDYHCAMEHIFNNAKKNARDYQVRKKVDVSASATRKLVDLGDFEKVTYDDLDKKQKDALDKIIENCEIVKNNYSFLGIMNKTNSGGNSQIKESIYKRATSLYSCINDNQKILFKPENEKVIDYIVCAFDRINEKESSAIKSADDESIGNINNNALFILASLLWKTDVFLKRIYPIEGKRLVLKENAIYEESDNQLSIYGYEHEIHG